MHLQDFEVKVIAPMSANMSNVEPTLRAGGPASDALTRKNHALTPKNYPLLKKNAI